MHARRPVSLIGCSDAVTASIKPWYSVRLINPTRAAVLYAFIRKLFTVYSIVNYVPTPSAMKGNCLEDLCYHRIVGS